jgi:hypothetical protein
MITKRNEIPALLCPHVNIPQPSVAEELSLQSSASDVSTQEFIFPFVPVSYHLSHLNQIEKPNCISEKENTQYRNLNSQLPIKE